MIDTTSLMEITERPPLVFTRGEGSWLFDDTGKRYLDFVQGWAVNSLGHSPAVIVEALAAQAGTLITPSPAFYNEPAARLARTLARHSCFQRARGRASGVWCRRARSGAARARSNLVARRVNIHDSAIRPTPVRDGAPLSERQGGRRPSRSDPRRSPCSWTAAGGAARARGRPR